MRYTCHTGFAKREEDDLLNVRHRRGKSDNCARSENAEGKGGVNRCQRDICRHCFLELVLEAGLDGDRENEGLKKQVSSF